MQIVLDEVAVYAKPDSAVLAAIAAEFPSIHVRFVDERVEDRQCLSARSGSGRFAPGQAGLPVLHSSEWRSAEFDTWAFDCAIDALAQTPFALHIAGDDGAFPVEVLNRCQRHIGRRNTTSHAPLFDRVLQKHRALHDLDKPLVRADYNHELDVWQWLLRLDPDAPLALQLAALFHDIERLATEADERIEHLAPDYQAFKDAHARRGAAMTDAVLANCAVPERVRTRVVELIAEHEHRSDDAEVALLNDADALSFFSLNSPGYADYFGREQTRVKVAYTWNRMRDGARRKLASVHLRDDVRAMLQGTSFATGA